MWVKRRSCGKIRLILGENIIMIDRVPMGFKSILMLLFLWICFLPGIHEVCGQSLQEISSIKVDDLTDQQIQQLVKRAEDAGLTESELIQMAQLRGVP
jgi:hypothetical protein